jgi:hypothetical protein
VGPNESFNVAEVEEAIRTCAWGAAELGRLDCRKDFAYGREWNGKVYATKQVRPVFVDEPGEIVVITVYTYYLSHENQLRCRSGCVEHHVPLNHGHQQTSGEGIAADYDSEGRLPGLEILDAQKRFGGKETIREVVLEGLESAAAPLALHDKPAKEYGA